MARHNKTGLGMLLLTASVSTASHGAGFAIIEQSVTGLGRAFAGSAAVAEDASTLFFNPAGMTYLDRAEMNLALNYIAPKSEFRDEGSSIGGLMPLTGGTAGDAAENAIVPNFYYAHPINDRTVVGLGISAPFGLVTDYNDTWIGRYHAVRSDLKTVNINPAIAFKADDKWSLGFGINAQYIDLELSQMADLGAAAGFPQNTSGFNTDAKVKLEADDWSWGYNLGLIYQATEATRIALAYRSKVSHHLTGKGKIKVPDNPVAQGVAAAGGLANSRISGSVDLPETASIAFHHQINAQWAVMADATWTRWSRFQELVIKSANGSFDSAKEENWDNAMRYGLGLDYAHSDRWTFRAGVAYDETPVPNAQFRTARIADNDRKWVAFGASYRLSDRFTIDASYAHLFVSDPRIDETDDNGYNLKGKYDNSVDLFGVQLRWFI